MKINVKYILAAAVSAVLIVLFVILGNKEPVRFTVYRSYFLHFIKNNFIFV